MQPPELQFTASVVDDPLALGAGKKKKIKKKKKTSKAAGDDEESLLTGQNEQSDQVEYQASTKNYEEERK